MREMPYFLTNPEWYTVDPDDDERGYKLTDKAPEEAIESYNEFYSGTVTLDGVVSSQFTNYVFE